MPRQKFRSKYGTANNKNKAKTFDKYGSKKIKKKSEHIDRNIKKHKFIRRNQENEEALRKQQELELNFKKKNLTENVLEEDDELDDSSDEENPDALGQLISTFGNASGKQSQNDVAIESEDDSESDENGDDQENDSEEYSDGDFEFPEKFEEQSQPRGRKYRSSEEEEEEENDDDGSGNENKSDSDDELEMDEPIQNLKPEGLGNKGHFDDSIEDDEENDSENGDSDAARDINAITEEKKGTDDKFDLHFGFDLSPQHFEYMTTTHSNSKKEVCNWPNLGRVLVELPTVNENDTEIVAKKKKKLTLLDDDTTYATEGTIPTPYNNENFDFEMAGIKVQLRSNVIEANKCNVKNNEPFTNLQYEIFSIMNNYQDLFYPDRNHLNGEEIRFMYTLHAINHIMKTRTKILNHNNKLKMMGLTDSKSIEVIPDQYRDHGLFRTKVLIIVPFRESALRIVKNLVSILYPSIGNDKTKMSNNSQVMHYKRFLDEYGNQTLHFPKKNPKPEDYELTFAGNSDDTFRIGITLTRKCIKLYSDFYSSDIIIASPLGLRMVVGAPGDKERDYDFLASIEVLILDQAEIFLAQNWDHLLHVLDHLHLQPQSARSTDFSRVRSWCLNGWSRFYRQTLLFASHELAEFRSLFNSRCSNYRGKVRTINPIEGGSIKHVALQIPQTFHRIDVSSIQSSFDQRFDYFVNTILPQFKTATKAHCLIFIPSYFDFVRIRNYFKNETMSFTQICEYTKDAKIDRARSMFFHSGVNFMLYSERSHFFRRTRLKGIRHLIMYQPPTWPHFYPEIINLMQNCNQNPRDGIGDLMSVTVLYTKYDMLQIASIVGSAQANEIAQSSKATHVFTTSD